jgi:hypothetical protein
MHQQDATHTAKCLRCGRTLRSAKSVSRSYGAWCAAKIRAAALAEAVKGFAAAQVEKARELIELGGLVPVRAGIFRAVSSRGDGSYLTHPATCSCAAAKRGKATPCYHSLAARIVVATRKAA